MKKVATNFIYQGLYQVLLIILPIITIPIVSNALGPQGIGIYNYVNSITIYFLNFAGLGLSVYGAREISRVRDDKIKLSRKFWEIQFFNVIVALITLLTFIVFTRFLNYSNYYLLQSFVLLGALLDISWFYTGIEDFKKIALSNTAIKIISFCIIVIFVNDYSDLWIYVAVQSTNVFLSQVILWCFIRNKVLFIRIKLSSVFSHFRPSMEYFVGKIAITLYTTLTTTLLGILDSKTSVGYYSNSLILVTIFLTLIGTLDTVLLPRMTNLHEKNEKNNMMKILKIALHLNLFVTIPGMFGIIATNEKLINWFFGEKFEFIKDIVPFLAPLLIIMALGSSIYRTYLVPQGKVKQINKSLIVGALIGLLLNLSFIPKFGVYGAVVATVLSQLFVTIVRIYELYKETDFRFEYLTIFKFLIAGIVMLISINLITKEMSSSFITTITQGLVGILIYMIVTTLLKVNPLVQMGKKILKKN